jgi:hypothetical protein
VNVPSGGPAGDDDAYMHLTSIGGMGPGSRMSVINLTQWAGDYLTAGIDEIGMDLKNIMDTDLHIRLLFENPTQGPPTDVAMTEAFVVPAHSDWTHAVFSVGPGDLITILGDVNVLLSNTTAIRIFHGVDPVFPPEPIVAQLGVDNIQAAAPTPTVETSWGRIKATFE